MSHCIRKGHYLPPEGDECLACKKEDLLALTQAALQGGAEEGTAFNRSVRILARIDEEVSPQD